MQCNAGGAMVAPFTSMACSFGLNASSSHCLLTSPSKKSLHLAGIKEARYNVKITCRKEDLAPVIIVPGWLSDSSQYNAMASYLRSKGLNAQVLPLKWYNWIPSLGGRSVRPILDRIDATIAMVLNNEDAFIDDEASEIWQDYTLWDFMKEFRNPKNGAQPPLKSRDELLNADKQYNKVTLVAHSAGGWICRILLGGKVPYDGKMYEAAQNVRALITLGTPHVCTDKLTKRNMDFVNGNYPGTAEADQGVEYVCIAGKYVQGETGFGGLWKDFAWQSYELCCGKGDVWGDGVIPVECAIHLQGASHVILEDVEHFPSTQKTEQRRWYGSPDVIDSWLPSLLKLFAEDT